MKTILSKDAPKTIKHHVNCKILTDDLRLTHHIRGNRSGLVNRAAVCAGERAFACIEHENHEDATNKNFKRKFHRMFSPLRNELSLTCLEVGTDRGCWERNVIVTLVLGGSSAFGIIKIHAWFPMNFGQVLKMFIKE